MAKLLHRVSVFDQDVAASGLLAFDLPVNPLSVVLLCLRPLNNTATLTNYQRIMGVCSAVNRVSVMHRGASLFSMSGQDAVALNFHRHGIVPWEANASDTDNSRLCVVLPLILGRFAYDSDGCVPASRRGELNLELDLSVSGTGFDDLRVSAETIELLGAKPKWMERKVTLSQTFAATGDNDVQLPTGNVFRGFLLYGTTGFTGGSPAPSWGRVELYQDGEQVAYSSTDFEVALTLSALLGRQAFSQAAHAHRVDATSASTTELSTGPVNVGSSDGMENYAWIDLDPTRDDEFSINTSKSSSCYLRADAETADAVRVVSIERVSV